MTLLYKQWQSEGIVAVIDVRSRRQVGHLLVTVVYLHLIEICASTQDCLCRIPHPAQTAQISIWMTAIGVQW